MGFWKKLEYAAVAIAASAAIVVGGPAVILGEASIWNIALVETACVTAVSMMAYNQASSGISPIHPLAQPDAHKTPAYPETYPDGTSIYANTPSAVEPDDDDMSVGSNDPMVVTLPWDPAWGQDPYDDVEPMEIVGTSTVLGDKRPGPGSETETEKKKKQNPLARRGDFSGLVNTFYNPLTSAIIGFKGIPRKRKFSRLAQYSSFWKDQFRTPPTTPARGPRGVFDSAMRAYLH